MVDAEGNPTWEASDFFLENFNIHFYYSYMDSQDADVRAAIIATYYSFTSLSTVGFGDFHPKSDYERLFIAFVLLTGVAVFSFIMGNFIAILNEFKLLNEDLDQGDKLT